MADFSPREIVAELDRFIVGQSKAKRAVAIALRDRWRRQHLEQPMRDEVLPKNILMVGPTGCGKTEIARRLAKLTRAPFLKIEATKFTEIGYVGRDVEQIIRDLLEQAIELVRAAEREEVTARADLAAEDRVLDALVGAGAGTVTRDKFRKDLRAGKLDEQMIELELDDHSATTMPSIEIPGQPGTQMGMLNLGELFGKAFAGRKRKATMKVSESYDVLIAEESDKLLDQDKIIRDAIALVENHGIVFLDEIDKICVRDGTSSRGEVSREGVQRDLLPLIEGSIVSTRHGQVRTDHILFIASGAFHLSKPSDLLPELQGRLPIRVELDALARDDYERILIEPESSLPKQYQAMLAVEGVELRFTEGAITKIADFTFNLNSTIENIGARRLHTVLEKLLEQLSFEAPEQSGESVEISAADVEERLAELAEKTDLARYVL
ncbi:MAG: ATP-dependent protease ATPase subunit HslU [Pseudomonadota bacterium]